MSTAAELQSGKGHRDENFPVASLLIRSAHRSVILAFYRFARAADDIADHPAAPAAEKLRLLDAFRASLLGERDDAEVAVALREMLRARNLSPQHGCDLLEAFRRDVTVNRTASWDALLDYCRYSAMPVGRFVLDVHGESRDCWPANDALCAALQIVNHLQDCGRDCREIDRVYVPQDALAAAGVPTEALGAAAATPALRAVLGDLARRTMTLLDTARPFAGGIRDRRLAFEVTVIQRFAEDLCTRLMRCDPLAERVHHTRGEQAVLLASAALRFATRRRRAAAVTVLPLTGTPR